MNKLFARLSGPACAMALLSLSPAGAQETVSTTTAPVTTNSVSDLAAAGLNTMPGTPIRVIPPEAGMARMELSPPSATEPRRAKLDGKVVNVAPGVRIFSTETLLVNPAALAGKKLSVRYKLDLYGQLLTAWVMTDAEVKAWKAAH
ncbi:hypothetical protein [Cupriavidus sp. 2SB]|uniref:hypothetical protein n=1 Tax=Cupriavidus sp. 2SB TaxID=2502199 RepID=UPI0010F75AB6|nr:hypothetical protein [Cupriavidus sp. 2SB]